MAKADVQGIRTYIDTWTAKSIELRQIVVPDASAHVHTVHAALVQARGKLDALEELVSQAIALKGTTSRGERAARDAVDDAWDAEYHRRRQAGRFSEDYKSAKEKDAEINLAIREVRLNHREMTEVLSDVTECLDRLKLKYFAMRDIREELLTRAKTILPFETHLDRG
jgi:hypothetical protein